MTKVSFAKVAPSEAGKPSDSSAEEADESTAVAQNQSTALSNSDGAGDDEGYGSSDIKLPRLKLLQGTSDKKLLAAYGFGSLLLKDSVVVAKAAGEGTPSVPATIVFVKLISKTYTERVAKFGDPSKFARNLAEVDDRGGTADWRLSKENRNANSNKPWYQVNANCLVLVQKPDGVDDDHFPFEADGKFYAPALYSVKSFAYEEFFQEIATAKATGELRKGGWSSRFIKLIPEIRAGKGNAEFAVPTVKFGELTPDSVREIAAAY